MSRSSTLNRGDALQIGISIDTDGKRWNVMLTGSETPDWTFSTFELFTAWLEEQNEGMKTAILVRRSERRAAS